MADPENYPSPTEDGQDKVGTSNSESGLNLDQVEENEERSQTADQDVLVTVTQDESNPGTPINQEKVEREVTPVAESRTSLKKSDPIMKTLSPELQQGYRILRELMSDNNKAFNWAFLNAVDDTHPDTSDYYDVVDNPMWLKRMKDKFVDGTYDTITQFVSDFRLMLENCYRYNGPDHFISKRGQRLEMMLEQKLALLSRDLREKTSVTATSGGKLEESFSSGMRRRVKSTYQRDTSALLSQLRQEEAQREKENRKQQILDRKAANEALIQEQLEWENGLLKEPIKSQMNMLWELPQIGHFLFLCQDPLNVGEIPQFELERGFAMPKQSSCIQAVMTTLLSTPHQRTKLDKTGMMPYSVWNEKLRIRLSTWYKCLTDFNNDILKTSGKLGIDRLFFDIIGMKNPLDRKKFHELSYYRRIWIVKSLCDNCLETQESLREAIESQPIQEQHEYLIGYDTKGNFYIHFPQFCGADLRIYKQKPFPEPGYNDEEEEEVHSSAKKTKLETTPKKSTPVNSRSNSRLQTPESANLRRSRRGQSEESCNSNNNSSVKSTGSKRNISTYDETSNDSTSFPVSFSNRRTRASCRMPLFLDETSNDSTSLSFPPLRRKKPGGKRKRSRRLVEKVNDTESITESDFMDESTCSSLTECAIDDRLSEDRESVKSNSKVESTDNSFNDSQISINQDSQNNSLSGVTGDNSQSTSSSVLGEDPPNISKIPEQNEYEESKPGEELNCSVKHNSELKSNKTNNELDSQNSLSLPVQEENSNIIGLDNCDEDMSQSASPSFCDTHENHNEYGNSEKTLENSNINAWTSNVSPIYSVESSVQQLPDNIDTQPEKMDCSLQESETVDCPENSGHEVCHRKQTKDVITEETNIKDEAEIKKEIQDEEKEWETTPKKIEMEKKIGSADIKVEADIKTELITNQDKDNDMSDQSTENLLKETQVKTEEQTTSLDVKQESPTEDSFKQVSPSQTTARGVKKEDDFSALETANTDEIKKEEGLTTENNANIPISEKIEADIKQENVTTVSEVKKEADQVAMETDDKGEIKKEAEVEEESEEEFEPELGSFQMICDNVDDLRKLVDKFAEQEPVVIKRGNKEKVIQPPARKKCIVELHERLAFLLSELEPWESKLNAAMRKARVKIRKEFEEYQEEDLTEKWEGESESRTNTDVSDDEESDKDVEEIPDKNSEPKPKVAVAEVKVESTDVADDDIDFSSRGRLRKRRVIPNNIEESVIKKKKVIKKEETPAPTHIPNILHRQTPVSIGGPVPTASLTLQPTSMGHTIALRPPLTNQAHSASQLLRLSIAQKIGENRPRQQPPVSLVKQSSHPVIQQLLAKQSIQPQSLVNPSLVNPPKQKPVSSSTTTQPRIQYVITNQQQAPSNPQGKSQVTSLSSLPAGLLQQLIKNQAVKIQKNAKGETQLVLAAPLQITQKKPETSLSSQGPMVITPTLGFPGSTAASLPLQAVPTTDAILPMVTQTLTSNIQNNSQSSSESQTTITSNPSTMSSQNAPKIVQLAVVTSPSKPKYATNVTVKTLLENRAAMKSDTVTSELPTATATSTESSVGVSPSKTENSEISSKKVVAKLLQVPLEIPEPLTSDTASISTSLPTVNIKVPPPVTLPLIQPRKNITKTVQMINAPIPVTTKSKGILESTILSSNSSTSKPLTKLVSSASGSSKVLQKPGTVLSSQPLDGKIVQQTQKPTILPQNLASGSPNIIQGILTPQGLQIPSNLLSNSTGSVIFQVPKSNISTSTTQGVNIQRFSSASGVQMIQKPVTTVSTTQMNIRQPASYFILQPPNDLQNQKVQLQNLTESPVQTGAALKVQTVSHAQPGVSTVQLKSIPSQSSTLKAGNLVQMQSTTQGSSGAMQASNLVRQLADQQKLQVSTGQKTIIGQPATVQLPQNYVGLQGILPSGQVVQLQAKPGNVQNAAIAEGSQINIPAMQTVQLQGAVVGLKSPNPVGIQASSVVSQTTQSVLGQQLQGGKAQTVLMSPNTPNHSVRLQTVSQQILQQLQGQSGHRLVRPVNPGSGSQSQLQFHLNVAGNKIGLSPPPRFINKTSTSAVQQISPSKLPTTIHTPLNITIPHSISVPQNLTSRTPVSTTNVNLSKTSPRFVTPKKDKIVVNSTSTISTSSAQIRHGLESQPVKAIGATQAAAFQLTSVPSGLSQPVVKEIKPHDVWPNDKVEHKKMNPSTRILHLADEDLSNQRKEILSNALNVKTTVTGQSPEKATGSTVTGERINSDSGKQKLLLYNIGGQLMTAQGIPVTVDHGVLKIVPQATIQIGSQTLTVRAPGQSQNDLYQIPVTMSGNVQASTVPLSTNNPTTQASKAQTLVVNNANTTANAVIANLQSGVSIAASQSTLATFPYSFSSQAVITNPVSSSIGLSTTQPQPLISHMNQIPKYNDQNKDRVSMEHDNHKTEVRIENSEVLAGVSGASDSNENKTRFEGNVRGTFISPDIGSSPVVSKKTDNEVTNGNSDAINREQGKLNTIQSPEKEAAKNLLALANQAFSI